MKSHARFEQALAQDEAGQRVLRKRDARHGLGPEDDDSEFDGEREAKRARVIEDPPDEHASTELFGPAVSTPRDSMQGVSHQAPASSSSGDLDAEEPPEKSRRIAGVEELTEKTWVM